LKQHRNKRKEENETKEKEGKRLTWVRRRDCGKDEERESFHAPTSGPGLLQDL
jgi:hypothetical protein